MATHSKVIEDFCNRRPKAYDAIVDLIETFNGDDEALLVIELETLRQRYPALFYSPE